MMMRKLETVSHLIIHTAAAFRLKNEYAEGKTEQQKARFIETYDGDPADIFEPVDQSAENIRHYHMHLKPPPLFSDIGYHYVIRFDGSIEKGRSEKYQGAHCLDAGMNKKSLGICCTGNGDIAPFTEAQISALSSLVNVLRRHYDVPIENVIGHRETGALKSCPGKLVNMNDLRNEIEAQQIVDGTWAEIKKYYSLEEQIAFVTGKLKDHE